MKKIHLFGAVIMPIVLIGGAALITYLLRINDADRGGKTTSVFDSTGVGLRAYDPDNMNELLPYVSEVFTGRVIEQTGTRDVGIMETQFSVDVLDSIKGVVRGTVTVSQLGGIKNGEWQIMEGKTISHGDSSDTSALDRYLLKPGHTYLFLARLNDEYGWYSIAATSQAHVDLQIDPGISNEEAKTVSASHPSVKMIEEKLTDMAKQR